MKARVLRPEEVPRAGMVLARGVGELQKGAVLSQSAAEALRGKELNVIEMEPGDLHEEAAGRRLAAAAAGEGVLVQALAAGSWPLAAKHRGLVEVDEVRLDALNDSDDLAVVTVPAGQVVLEDEVVARAKIVPFVTREEHVRHAEAVGAVVRVRPFLPLRISALVQEKLDEEALKRFETALAAKVSFFGSRVLSVERSDDLAGALRASVRSGAQVVFVVGSKLMDPLDPAMQALEKAGAKMEKRGVPLHPGTLLWVASLDGIPVVGAPACALFSRPTAFDLLLPRLLAGDRLSRASLSRLGAGGLLTKELAFRLPPYRPGLPRGELSS